MISIKINKDEQAQTQAPKVDTREAGRATVQNKAVNAALVNAGKQILSQGINQYAELTGNYALTRAIDDTISIASDVLTIAVAGPIGAIVVGTKYATQIANSLVKQKRAEQDIALSRERVGFMSTQQSRYSK